jgi:hypothetical protein
MRTQTLECLAAVLVSCLLLLARDENCLFLFLFVLFVVSLSFRRFVFESEREIVNVHQLAVLEILGVI